MKKLITFSVLVFYLTTHAQIISTVAGTGTATYSGDGGQATAATLNSPTRVAVDNAGNLFITDRGNNRVRKIVLSTGIITTVAGSGTAGFGGDGAAATAAKLNAPAQTIVDANGNLYISDSQNQRIRKVTASTGIITTIVGNGAPGFVDGVAATAAELNNPYDMALDAQGNLFISDRLNNRIRKVIASTNFITTVAGTGTASYTGDGAAATAATINNPIGLALDASGNIYIGDYGNKVVRRIDGSTAIITTFAGNGASGFTGDGGQATAAELGNASTVAVDAAGNVYISDVTNNCIRKVTISSSIINTIAGNQNPGFSGDGGQATAAELNQPGGAVVDANGSIYIADQSNNRVRKITTLCPVSFSGVTSICSGTGTILTASGASSYTWSANAGSANTATVNVAPTTNTTYTVSSSGATCVGTNTITVNVTTTPTLAISGDTTICSGNNTTLTASGATSYTWASSAFSVTTSSVNVSPTTDDTFTVTAANGNCTDVANVTIHVTATPSLNISGATTICSGNSTILTASGATTYTWSANAGSATTNTVSINPSANTTYSLIGANGICAVTNTINVTVNATPTLAISLHGTNPSCFPYLDTLFASGATSYTWSPATGLSSVNAAQVFCNPGFTITYTLTGSNGTCVSTTVKTVSVNPTPSAPVITAPTTANNFYCQGHPTSLVVNSGINVAVWYSGNTLVNQGGIYTPPANLPAGTYTFSVIDSSSTTGCINAQHTANTLTLSLTVNPTPTLNVSSAFVDTAKCGALTGGISGISVANITGGTANYNYQWYNGSNAVSGATSPSLSGVGAGTYSLHVADANGCVAVTVGGVSSFSVPATAAVIASFTTNPGTASGPAPLTINFTNTSTGATSYQWNFGDGNTSTAVNPSNTYTFVATYTVSLVARNGTCLDTAKAIIVSYVTGIETISNNLHADVNPNPSNGTFTIETNASDKQMIFIFDVNGKLVFNQFIFGKTTVDAGDLNAGVYSLNITSNQGVVNKKLVIVK